MEKTKEFLKSMGLPGSDNHAMLPSSVTFDDGGHYKIEIPSVEGPGPFKAVVAEAKKRKVTVQRVSQGSGMMLHTPAELKEMAKIGHDNGIEVTLFVGPRTPFDVSAQAKAPAGGMMGWAIRGTDNLVYAIDDVLRGAEYGIRSFLVSDLGQMTILRKMIDGGELPANCTIKASASFAPANPAFMKVIEQCGATTVNIAGDLSVAQMGALRQATDLPIDIYIEAPDPMGAFIRFYEAPEMLKVAAPIYFKLGLSNASNVYPSGGHVENYAVACCVEKVRRAQLLVEYLERYTPEFMAAAPGQDLPGVPEIV